MKYNLNSIEKIANLEELSEDWKEVMSKRIASQEEAITYHTISSNVLDWLKMEFGRLGIDYHVQEGGLGIKMITNVTKCECEL